MTTDELLEAVERRGLTIKVKDGQPHLSGPEEKKTKPLLAMLSERRQEIVERITKVKTIAWVEWSDDKDHAMPLKNWQQLEDDGVLMDYFDWRLPKGTKVVHLPEGENHPAWRK